MPDDFAEARRAAYVQAFTSSLSEVRGVRAAVEELHDRGHDTCVASSGSHERMRLTLATTNLRPLFEGRVHSADEVARGKPAPDLFLFAARQRGHEPASCVVVEDSASGVAAARAAGMLIIGYAGLTPRGYLSSADEVLYDMTDLVPAIERLTSQR